MSELFLEALDLAVVGMATVVVFLTVLVFLTLLMSKLVMWLGEPEAPAPSNAQARSVTSPVEPQTSPAVLAAIAAAVKQYRERQ